MQHPLIVIGTGLAGYNFARAFRKLDNETPLVMITQDDGSYYSKPMLSAAFAKDKTPETLPISDVNVMREQLNAEIHTYSEVTAIQPDQKSVAIGDKTYLYSHCVLASGAKVMPIPFKGNAVDAVQRVNNLEDYKRFYETLVGKKSVAIIGAGLIGCEFANDLSNAGFKVDVIAQSQTPLDILVPNEVGALLQKSLSKVSWHLGQSVVSIDHAAKNGIAITLGDGSVVEADVVLTAIGIQPDCHLAKTANLTVNRGIVVDTFLSTSDPHISALGDCCEFEGATRLYTAPLIISANALAKTLSGTQTPVHFPAMPVIVKTPAHPIVIVSPAPGCVGEWTIDSITDEGSKALYLDAAGKLLGFVITGNQVVNRADLMKQLS